jgi:predicted nucleic acid-binding Zn ribbon protein
VRRRTRSEPERLGRLVPRVLEDLGFDAAVRVVRIAERWEEAVGPEIARHCQPTALRDGTLEATVASSAWCQQLRLQAPEILAALRRVFGDDAPADLRLRVG